MLCIRPDRLGEDLHDERNPGRGHTRPLRHRGHRFQVIFSFIARSSLTFTVSFFEIYEGRLFDLLNDRNKLNLLEDKNQHIQVQGLVERPVNNPSEMLAAIEYGQSARTTHATTSNDTSSRSHAICQITVRQPDGSTLGKLLLVDLAVLT